MMKCPHLNTCMPVSRSLAREKAHRMGVGIRDLIEVHREQRRTRLAKRQHAQAAYAAVVRMQYAERDARRLANRNARLARYAAYDRAVYAKVSG